MDNLCHSLVGWAMGEAGLKRKTRYGNAALIVSDSDPRFAPVGPAELDEIDLEISVLTPEREIESVDDIEIGRHGLIVEQGYRRGLLLPQVPLEHRWDRTTYL